MGSYFSHLSLLGAGLANCDLPQETVVCVKNCKTKVVKTSVLVNISNRVKNNLINIGIKLLKKILP